MSKICPDCGKPPIEKGLVKCHICGVPFIEESEMGLKLSKSQLDQISKNLVNSWRFWIQFSFAFLVALLLIGVPTVTVIGVHYATKSLNASLTNFNARASNELAAAYGNAYSAATNQLARQFHVFAQDASNQIAQAYSSVTNQIAEEFQTPRIKRTVETVAKGEAKAILEAEVRPMVDSFKEDSLFIRTIARAQAYDFKAYQRLLEIGGQTNDNAKLANQMVAEIDRALTKDRSEFVPRRVFVTATGTNFYSGPFTSDELAVRFSRIGQDKTIFNREGFVNTVGKLKQSLFLGQLIGLFSNETDLAVADRLTIAISDIAKEDFHPRDFERIQAWWKDHRNSYTNWPIEALELGLHEFSSVHYPQAAEAFEQVLKLDSAADMSRAYAIACYWETGQTNRAALLAKEFQNPSLRWAQWATAKAELESGNISNATVHFFAITTNFPYLDQLPNQRSHVFRHINWELFNRLSGTNKP